MRAYENEFDEHPDLKLTWGATPEFIDAFRQGYLAYGPFNPMPLVFIFVKQLCPACGTHLSTCCQRLAVGWGCPVHCCVIPETCLVCCVFVLKLRERQDESWIGKGLVLMDYDDTCGLVREKVFARSLAKWEGGLAR